MSQRGSKSGNFCARVSHISSSSETMERLKSKWAYLETLIEKNEKYIQSLNGQINSLQSRLPSTYSIQKKVAMKSWITEKEMKIESVEKKNLSVQKQIEEIKEKIIYYKKL